MATTDTVRRKLLFVGLPPTSYFSGQGRVSRALTDRLNQVFETRVAGWGCTETSKSSVFIYPNSEKWWEIISEWKPDVLFLSHDVWRFPQLPDVRRRFPNLKIVGYFTIDGDPVSKHWFPIFDACDLLLVPSQWGKDVIFERYSSRPVVVVPQGIELSFYFQQLNKSQVKREVDQKTRTMSDTTGQKKLYLENKFVISFSGMNQTKKNIGAILDGFNLFAGGKDTLLFLVLHSHEVNVFGSKVLSDYDLTDLYSWKNSLSKIKLITQPLSEENLLNLYLVSDLMLCPSIGEGFGLFVLEAMATGAVPMISYYSAFVELPAPSSCFFLQPAAFYRSTWNVRRAVVAPEEIAAKLEAAYTIWREQPQLWSKMQADNWQRVLSYSWDRCAVSILRLLTDLTNNVDFFDVELRKLR